jgi:hypothetical protein
VILKRRDTASTLAVAPGWSVPRTRPYDASTSSPNARVGPRRRLRVETKGCVRAGALMSRFTIYSGRTLGVEEAAPV